MCAPHRPLTVTRKYLVNLYDALYKEGQRLLDKVKPCNIKPAGVFLSDRSKHYKQKSEPMELMNCDGYSEPGPCCCGGCRYLGEEGCRVKALACKLWLCHCMTTKHPKLERALMKLRKIARRHEFHIHRASKRYSLGEAFKVNANIFGIQI